MKPISFYLVCLLAFLTACSNTNGQTDPIPPHDTFTIGSKVLGEDRVINIWVPQGYSSSNDSLPVMYMADGGIKEDFPHIANTLDQLVKTKKIKPLLLVGIENTQRRRDLTGFTEVEEDKKIAPVVGGSEKFRAFIEQELFAEIEKRYPCTTERSLIGESASGLFVMETFFLKPELFSTYIAFDPSLWWNNHYLVRTATTYLDKLPSTPKRLWFASSNAEDIAPYTKELAQTLARVNKTQLSWKYADEPKEKHSTIFRATKEKAIIWALSPDR